MQGAYLLAIDQGTTATTVLVVTLTPAGELEVVARASAGFAQHYPQPSWVEHELADIWQSVRQACQEALSAAEAKQKDFSRRKLAAIGLTNQRETLCLYDRKSLKALRRGIVWQCKRSLAICRQLQAEGAEALIRQKTGLLCDPYFTGSKLRWVMDHEPAVAQAIRAQTACIGTVDTYLVSRLTAGESYVTEASNASRTLLFDIERGQWDDELLRLFHVPTQAGLLPEVRDSAGRFGMTKGLDFLPDGIPITGILGDQQAALAGQGCFNVGEAKCTYGTGAFLLVQEGERCPARTPGVLSTVAWRLQGRLSYAREGAAFIAGAAVQFLRDNLGLLTDAGESERLAAAARAAPELYFVPALSGLGAPWWLPDARGAFLGLTRGSGRAELVRACLEGIALQVHDLLTTLAPAGQAEHSPLKVLRCDGGASANGVLLQIQADLAGLRVERAANLETTALGAALFAGLGAGLIRQEDLRQGKGHRVDLVVQPADSPEARANAQAIHAGWQRAVQAVALFAAKP